MSNLQVKLPNSIEKRLRELAKRDDVSVNQFIASAVAEKLAAFDTVEFLKRRAKKVSRKRFERALAQVPSDPPIPGDELPE